jgi:hypothetical protein
MKYNEASLNGSTAHGWTCPGVPTWSAARAVQNANEPSHGPVCH